jgi:hypothetical protein
VPEYSTETGDDFRFSFGNIEWGAIGFRDTGDEVDQEQAALWQPVPTEQSRAAGLVPDDFHQIQALRNHQDANQSEAHGDFVRHDLRRGAQAADECILELDAQRPSCCRRLTDVIAMM